MPSVTRRAVLKVLAAIGAIRGTVGAAAGDPNCDKDRKGRGPPQCRDDGGGDGGGSAVTDSGSVTPTVARPRIANGAGFETTPGTVATTRIQPLTATATTPTDSPGTRLGTQALATTRLAG